MDSDILVPIALFAVIFLTAKTFSDNRTKRKLIDAGVSAEFARELFTVRSSDALSSLKWGLVAVGLGLALIVVQFLPYDFEEPIAYGLMFVFAGAGLFLYYAIAGWGQQRQPSSHAALQKRRAEQAPPERAAQGHGEAL